MKNYAAVLVVSLTTFGVIFCSERHPKGKTGWLSSSSMSTSVRDMRSGCVHSNDDVLSPRAVVDLMRTVDNLDDVAQHHIIERLLRLKAGINAQDDEGMTALHYAMKRQYHESVSGLLLHKKADLTCRDKKGATPLDTACRSGNVRKVLVLLPYAEGCSGDHATCITNNNVAACTE